MIIPKKSLLGLNSVLIHGCNQNRYNIVSQVFINVYIFLFVKWHLYIICIEVPILLWFIAQDTFNQALVL